MTPQNNSTTPISDSPSHSNSHSPSPSICTSISPTTKEKKLELSLSGRGLSTLPLEIISEHAHQIVKLDLSDNQLQNLSTLQSLPRLHTLILDKNRLESLENFPHFPCLTTLWINNNVLSDLTHLLDILAAGCPNLTYLSMLRNPACPDMYFSDGEAEAYQRYRYFTIYRLKKLQYLDATPVTIYERQEAESRGEYAVITRPTAENSIIRRDLLSNGSTDRALVGGATSTGQPPKVATFLAKSKPRYDGTNSEGNRFIVNDDL